MYSLFFCRKQGPTYRYAFKSTFSFLAQSSSSWDVKVKWLTQVDRKQYERKDFSFLCFTYMKEDLMAGGFTWSAYLIWVLEPNMCQEPSTVDLVLVFFFHQQHTENQLWNIQVEAENLRSVRVDSSTVPLKGPTTFAPLDCTASS